MSENLPDNLDEHPTVRSLTLLVGEDAVAALSAELGGRRMYIHPCPGQSHPLAVVVGLDAARKIGQVYGGLQMEVPVLPGRRAAVLRLARQGLGPSFIARELKLPRRSVIRTIEAENERRQGALF